MVTVVVTGCQVPQELVFASAMLEVAATVARAASRILAVWLGYYRPADSVWTLSKDRMLGRSGKKQGDLAVQVFGQGVFVVGTGGSQQLGRLPADGSLKPKV